MAETDELRIVFMGTPAFSVPSLETLIGLSAVNDSAARVVGVFTQPDRPSGRGQRQTAPPVKEVAQAAGIPVFQPERLRRTEAMADLQSLAPDLIVVAAYAQILSQRVLDLPRFGCLNVHASLLPRYRGAAPIQAAILQGDAETGVTIMVMEAGLDTGPMLSRVAVPIGPHDTARSLAAVLSTAGAALLARTLPGWLAGTIVPVPQDEAAATLTRPLRKEDGLVDWTRTAAHIERQVRAMYPWPSAYTHASGALLKLLAVEVQPGDTGALVPGTVLVDGAWPQVVTGSGLLLLRDVQPAGRRSMPGDAWLRGVQGLRGTVLGS